VSGKGKGAVMKCPECESILPFVFAYATAEKKTGLSGLQKQSGTHGEIHDGN